MLDLPVQIISIIGNAVLFIFVIYYFWEIRSKEKQYDEKKANLDAQYHHVVDEAMAKERKILEDATDQAGQIISSAKNVSTSSQEQINAALQKIIADSHHQALTESQDVMNAYGASLKQIAQASLANFSALSKELEESMHKQVKEFQQSMVPLLQKELEEYKASRMKETEQLVGRVIQKASQDIFNKTINLEDHHKLMIEALEKARKEGIFD